MCMRVSDLSNHWATYAAKNIKSFCHNVACSMPKLADFVGKALELQISLGVHIEIQPWYIGFELYVCGRGNKSDLLSQIIFKNRLLVENAICPPLICSIFTTLIYFVYSHIPTSVPHCTSRHAFHGWAVVTM